MAFFVARSAIQPTPPVISVTNVGQTSAQINLVTPSKEPISGVSSYVLSRLNSGVVSQVATIPPTAFPYIDTTLANNNTYTYTLQGLDNTPQNDRSLPSNAVQITTQGTTPPPPTPNLRYNPGHYACFDYAGGVSASRFSGGDSGIISSTASGTADNLTGFSWIISWLAIDVGTTAPKFDWTVNDQYVNSCRAKNKRWWTWVAPFFLDPNGHSSCSAGTRTVPQWLYNKGVFQAQGNMLDGSGVIGGGCYPKYFNAGCFGAITAFMDAFIARYESDPLCEGLIFSIGSSIVVANIVDTLGTKQPQINYDTDYSDSGMVQAYVNFMQHWRSQTSILNLHMSLDYMFYRGDSNPANWTTMLNAVEQYKCVGGGPDCLTTNWVYPQAAPAVTGQTSKSSFCLTPQPLSRYATTQNANATKTNSCLTRGVSSDQYYIGWRGQPAYKGKIKWGKTQEITEMGGYIGQFGAADVWNSSGPNLYGVCYQHWDVLYPPTGGNVYGFNKAPNTQWLASTAYDAQFGLSVYRWIQQAGPITTPNPYP